MRGVPNNFATGSDVSGLLHPTARLSPRGHARRRPCCYPSRDCRHCFAQSAPPRDGCQGRPPSGGEFGDPQTRDIDRRQHHGAFRLDIDSRNRTTSSARNRGKLARLAGVWHALGDRRFAQRHAVEEPREKDSGDPRDALLGQMDLVCAPVVQSEAGTPKILIELRDRVEVGFRGGGNRLRIVMSSIIRRRREFILDI